MTQKTKEDLQAMALGAICGIIVSILMVMLLIAVHLLTVVPCK